VFYVPPPSNHTTHQSEARRMKLWVLVSLVTGLLTILCAFSVIAIMVTGWHENVTDTWNIAAGHIQINIVDTLKENLDFLMFAATSPPFIEPQLAQENMPFSDYNASQLTRMFTGYDGESGYHFNSFGMMIAGFGRVPGNETLPNAKLSWQVAKGFGCPEYIYAFSDASINPLFLGHCAYENGTVDMANIAYSGADWGLKNQEQWILDGTLDNAFLPVTELLGHLMLTFEVGYPVVANTDDDGNATGRYAVTFAEIDMNTFAQFVERNVTVLGGKGYAYVVETVNGKMVASTVPGSVFNAEGNRQAASTSTTPAIRETYGKDTTAGTPWIVTTTRYQKTGLDWTIYVVVHERDIYGDMYYRTGIAIGISAVVIVVCIVLVVLLTKCLLGKHVDALVSRIRDNTVDTAIPLVSDLTPIKDAVDDFQSPTVEL